MVLEMLVRANKAEEHPARMFFLGLMYALLAIVISLMIFRGAADLVSVFFCVILLMPLYYDTLSREEYKEIHTQSERRLLLEHAQAVTFLIWIFCGMTSAYALAYIALPTDYQNDAFLMQTDTITEFNDALQNDVSGAAVSSSVFSSIIQNNLKVFFISLALGFLSGSGVLLIITWNASIIGVALGRYILEQSTTGSLAAPILGFLRYAIHGVPEIIAYFIAGIAGGLLSLAVIHHSEKHTDINDLLTDTTTLIAIGAAILVIAGIIEVYVIPMIV